MLGLLPGLRASCSRRAASFMALSLGSGRLQTHALGLHGELAACRGRSTQGALGCCGTILQPGAGTGAGCWNHRGYAGVGSARAGPACSLGTVFVPACNCGGRTSSSYSPLPPSYGMVVMGSLLSAGGRALLESPVTLCSILCFAVLGDRDLPSTSSSCMH